MKQFKRLVGEILNEKYVYTAHTRAQKATSGNIVGNTFVDGKKGANIVQHKTSKKFYAAGGSSTAYFQNKTKEFDSPEEAAAHYHR